MGPATNGSKRTQKHSQQMSWKVTSPIKITENLHGDRPSEQRDGEKKRVISEAKASPGVSGGEKGELKIERALMNFLQEAKVSNQEKEED